MRSSDRVRMVCGDLLEIWVALIVVQDLETLWALAWRRRKDWALIGWFSGGFLRFYRFEPSLRSDGRASFGACGWDEK